MLFQSDDPALLFSPSHLTNAPVGGAKDVMM